MSCCRAASARSTSCPKCLTLVQTGKSRRIPIILVGGEFWGGLVDWMRDKLVGEGMIGEDDLDLMQVIEEPEAIVEAIFDFYEIARLPADARRAPKDAEPVVAQSRSHRAIDEHRHGVAIAASQPARMRARSARIAAQ